MNESAPTLPLPIRLVPRKAVHFILVVFFGFFFVFACIWIVGSVQPNARLSFNDEPITDPAMRRLFPLFGLPFLLIGGGGLYYCLLRVLPRSPYYHVDLTIKGMNVRNLNKRETFAWKDLPAFEMLEVVSRDDDDTTRNYYAVAMRTGVPIVPTKSKRDPREIVRIAASDYAAKDDAENAQLLADWLNGVRDHVLERRPDDIDIPLFLRSIAIQAPDTGQVRSAPRSQTVIRR